MNRRTFLTASASAAAGVAAGVIGADPASHAEGQERPAIVMDPTPLFELSPYLFMQFMEPLGAHRRLG